MPLFSVEEGFSGSGQRPAMYGHNAYKPWMSPMSPSRSRRSPVANVRLPPPLSPATMRLPASMPSLSALATTHFKPETQSFKPAG